MVSAHEEQNSQYSSNDYYWGFSQNLREGDTYRWKLHAEGIGFNPIEGSIRVKIHENTVGSNLLKYLKENDSLEFFEESIADLFSIDYDKEIEHMNEIYLVHYLIVPTIFAPPGETSLNVFSDNISRNQLFVSYVNDTIDAACIQGCHVNKEAPFTTLEVSDDIVDDMYVIEGRFKVRDIPSTSYYSYEKGSFVAKYHIDTGLMEEWHWISDEGKDYLSINLANLSRFETYLIGMVSLVFAISIAFVIWVRKRYLSH